MCVCACVCVCVRVSVCACVRARVCSKHFKSDFLLGIHTQSKTDKVVLISLPSIPKLQLTDSAGNTYP